MMTPWRATSGRNRVWPYSRMRPRTHSHSHSHSRHTTGFGRPDASCQLPEERREVLYEGRIIAHPPSSDVSFLELAEIFSTLDKNGDGKISHAEMISGLRANPWMAHKLGMAEDVRRDDEHGDRVGQGGRHRSEGVGEADSCNHLRWSEEHGSCWCARWERSRDGTGGCSGSVSRTETAASSPVARA